MQTIEQSLLDVQAKIDSAATKSGRCPSEITLVAVSKTYPVATVTEAYSAGQLIFGENRVQELAQKADTMPKNIEWHLIGHLQTNKVKKVIEHASLIHSLDSLKLLHKIEQSSSEIGCKTNVLMEINISGEKSKFGAVNDDEIMLIAREAVNCQHVELKGVMTMAPFNASDDERRLIFSKLKAVRSEMEQQLSIPLPELSMGMSSDFEIAVEEGATIVRVGTAIFGQRQNIKLNQ